MNNTHLRFRHALRVIFTILIGLQMDLDALTFTCQHLRNERDHGMAKLTKQKQAAHSTCYRLRIKLRRLELANCLLLVVLTSSEVHNRELRDRVKSVVEAELSDLQELGV